MIELSRIIKEMARIQNENQANLRERKLRNNECFLLTNAQSVSD